MIWVLKLFFLLPGLQAKWDLSMNFDQGIISAMYSSFHKSLPMLRVEYTELEQGIVKWAVVQDLLCKLCIL